MIMTAEKERKSNPKASNAEWSTKKLTKSKENPPPVRWKCLCLSICESICLACQKKEQKFQGIDSDRFICFDNCSIWFIESFTAILLKRPEYSIM